MESCPVGLGIYGSVRFCVAWLGEAGSGLIWSGIVRNLRFGSASYSHACSSKIV